MDDVNNYNDNARMTRVGAASPLLLQMRARAARKPRRRNAKRDSQWERFNRLGTVAGSSVAGRPPDGAAVGQEPLHSGRRKVGGFGVPKSPIREELDDLPSSAMASTDGSSARQAKLADALHRVSNTWIASEDESEDGASSEDEHNDWQGQRPTPEIPLASWQALSARSGQQPGASMAAAKREHETRQQKLEERHVKAQSAVAQCRDAAANTDSDARATSVAFAEGLPRALAATSAKQRPRSAPPLSSNARLAQHGQRPSSAGFVREDPDPASLVTGSVVVSALDVPRRLRRRKPPMPAFKERPIRLVCRPSTAPQRLVPGRAELLGGGWSYVEPFDPRHPAYFWHGRHRRGAWGHPMEPEPQDRRQMSALLTLARDSGLLQEALRLERVAQLAEFKAGAC